MPLDRYGVLSGTLVRHWRDTPDDQGRWYHVNLEVAAQGGSWRCAIDVDSKMSAVGVEWRVVTLRPADAAAVAALAYGYHDLAHVAGSGALDYVRDPRLRAAAGCVFAAMPDAIAQLLLALAEAFLNAWKRGSNVEASDALEPLLTVGGRVFVFGEPFTTGLGMHNIHQNQGDPAGSQWWAENGIWQDGGTLVQRPDGSIVAFLNKFSSQAYRTDAQGHPAP
jgi:hypothetical protein